MGMASKQSTADFIVEQIALAGAVSARKMFGEYELYCDGKLVALICDDQLYLKPTEGGKAFMGAIEEGRPYPGAKPHLLVSGDRWDDRVWLTELVKRSADELPLPKPKPKKSKRTET